MGIFKEGNILSLSKRILITNFSALTAIQIVHYLAPLIILPYLVRIIGPEKFGVISFAQAVAYYFALIPDIGTGLYAPREIALIKDNRDDLASFVTGIISIKLIVLSLSLIVYFFLIWVVPHFRAEIWVFMFSAGFIIGESLIPVWFFQGIEKMINITIGIFIIRVLALVLILILIKNPNDYIYVPLINTGALIFGTFFLWLLIFLRERIVLKAVSTGSIKKIVKESFPLYISNVASNLNAGINIIVLGFLTPGAVVGYYAAAERLVKVGMGLLTQISNVFYPHISRILSSSREIGIAEMKKGFVAGMLLMIPATLFVISYAEFIVRLMLGNEFHGSIYPLRVLGALFLVSGLSNILGIQVLLSLGRRQAYMRPIIVGFILQLLLAFLFIPLLQEIGAALTYVLVQVGVLFLIIREVKKLSLEHILRSAELKLTILALALGTFALASRVAGLDTLISIGFFCLVYVVLVVILHIVDLKNWSLVT